MLDGAIVSEADASADALVITVDPFVPSRYDADSFDGLGTFPMMTLMGVLKGKLPEFMQDSGGATDAIDQIWTPAKMLFEYYLDSNWTMLEKTAKSKFGIDDVGETRHERSTVAYQLLAFVTVEVVGATGERGVKVVDRYSRKHLASIRREEYRALLADRDTNSQGLERDAFDVISHFIENYSSWAMGRLVRYIDDGGLDDLTLYRDEFTLARDLYQQGLELACKCLWTLMAAQNTVKRGDPNSFGGDHPDNVPLNKRPKNLGQFDKLPNAYKLAYVRAVPGWDSLGTLLNNQRRNTIGHATARHDLRSGRIVSDMDAAGISYLEFLNEVLGVFEALTTLMQALRMVRVAASPDFAKSEEPHR